MRKCDGNHAPPTCNDHECWLGMSLQDAAEWVESAVQTCHDDTVYEAWSVISKFIKSQVRGAR